MDGVEMHDGKIQRTNKRESLKKKKLSLPGTTLFKIERRGKKNQGRGSCLQSQHLKD